MSAPVDLFGEIRRRYDQLGEIVRGLGEDRLEQFTAIHLASPPQDSDALRFYSLVSWMYVAVYEVGAVSFRFLADRAVQMRLDPTRELAGFRRDVHALRTFLQHGLDPQKPADAEKRTVALRWMLAACKKEETIGAEFWPETTVQWTTIADQWDSSSQRFLDLTARVVAAIATDPSRDAIVSEWARRCTLGLRPHEFYPLVVESARALALPPLSPERVVQKHYSKWNNLLRLLDDRAEIATEARRIVDQTLIDDWRTYCPVNGDDIINLFSIPPGPEVGKLVQVARTIWMRERCSREKLIQLLEQHLKGTAN